MITSEMFKENYNLPIGEFVEQRGGSFKASYLSWAHAVRLMKERHPELAVEVLTMTDTAKPTFTYGNEGFVMIRITNLETGAVSPPHFYPVMDNKFNSIEKPHITDYNYAIQRATARVIAVHTGIGLKLYAGEDIPNDGAEGHIASLPKEEKPKSWKYVTVPAGKNKNKTLAEIGEKSLLWYIENWETAGEFRDALDEAKKSIQRKKATETEVVEPIDEIAEQTANDPTDPDLDEEVPF
jgi:hypothetical protein